MKVITNLNKDNHASYLCDLIENSDKMWLATAFLKMSGLELILPSIKKSIRNGKTIQIIAGQHFALTEPKALHTLRKQFLSSANSRIYLAHAVKSTEVFHPKIYIFKSGKKGTIISGSANITKGGLINNTECSTFIETGINEPIWKNALSYFNELLSDDHSAEATLMVIKQYETFYSKQKEHNRKSKAIPDRKKSQLNFNYANLVHHFKSFNNSKREQLFKDKTWHYKEAKKVLDKMVLPISIGEAIPHGEAWLLDEEKAARRLFT